MPYKYSIYYHAETNIQIHKKGQGEIHGKGHLSKQRFSPLEGIRGETRDNHITSSSQSNPEIPAKTC